MILTGCENEILWGGNSNSNEKTPPHTVSKWRNNHVRGCDIETMIRSWIEKLKNCCRKIQKEEKVRAILCEHGQALKVTGG
jgi:hypothetical protein